MLSYALRRIVSAVPLVLGVATILFFVLRLAPGDPAALYFGPGVSAEFQEQTRENLGLDEPLPVQYGKWLLGLVQGDFGYSLTRNRPVKDLILEALPPTLYLTGGAVSLAFLLGIALGVLQAVRQYSLLDSLLSAIALFFYSMPSFWLAIMLVLVFSVGAQTAWDWPIHFPASGMVGTNHDLLGTWGQIEDRIAHLVLPALSLALVLAGGIARYVRTSMLEVIRQDYIRTARAKGLPERRVVLRHALRNALLPVVTLFGVYFPFLLSGAVFIEEVFSWPGMGDLLVDAINQRDYPVVMAGSFLFAVMVVVGNLLADLLYGFVDPRIGYGERRAGLRTGERG